MRNGLRATASGVKNFFSFGGTNAKVNKGNVILHGDQSSGKKAELISKLFLGLALQSTPYGLIPNTVSAIRQGRRRYKELRNMTTQLVQVLTALGMSPGGVDQIVVAIRTESSATLSLSKRDEELVRNYFDDIANAAVAQGIDPSLIAVLLVDVRAEVGQGAIHI